MDTVPNLLVFHNTKHTQKNENTKQRKVKSKMGNVLQQKCRS